MKGGRCWKLKSPRQVGGSRLGLDLEVFVSHERKWGRNKKNLTKTRACVNGQF